jgi:hypothetical protein
MTAAHPSPETSTGIFLTAEWRNLAMLNYEVDPSLLLPFVPGGTQLDLWNGKTFVTLVGFGFLNTKVLGIPIPFHRNFEEVNLRFYVKRWYCGEIRRGVVFIKEIVPRWAIAAVARSFYGENYVSLPMSHKVEGDGKNSLNVEYAWKTTTGWRSMRTKTVSHIAIPETGSEAQFITEHYWGYAAQKDRTCVEYRVTHPSWKVWPVLSSSLTGDLTELYGKELAAVLKNTPSSAFLAEGSEVIVYRGRKILA